MTIPTDDLIVDPLAIARLNSPEEASNYIRERVGQVREQLAKCPPPPTSQLNALEYIKWERRLLMLHGQAAGALMFAQAFGHIPIPLFKQLKNEILGAMLRRASDVQMGIR